MNNIRELAELYGVTAKTPDSLNIFITEIYSHGYHDGKEFSSTPISLRDHFAGLAMQSLLTKASITVGSDSVAMAAYHVAHQMLKEKSRGEKSDD